MKPISSINRFLSLCILSTLFAGCSVFGKDPYLLVNPFPAYENVTACESKDYATVLTNQTHQPQKEDAKT